jgi:hypothetical protein
VRGEVDEAQTAKVNSKFFGIDPETTRMHIRRRMLPLANASKELAAIPAGPYVHQYVYFDIAKGNGELLLQRPGPELPEGSLLWDAPYEHFAGELRTPTTTTIEEWPKIAGQWSNFFINQKKGPPAAPGQP